MLDNYQLQRNLKYFGQMYYKGPIDGIIGEATEGALRQFQSEHEIKASGVWDESTSYVSELLVKKLKKRLNAHGAYLVIDGIMDEASVEAVKVFQRRHSLNVTGIADKDTLRALEEIPDHLKADEEYLSAHFALSEFMCPCAMRFCSGYPYEISDKLVRLLERIRREVNAEFPLGGGYEHTIIIKEGPRCHEYAKRHEGIASKYLAGGHAAYIAAGGLAQEKLNETLLNIGAFIVHREFDKTLISVKGVND